MNLTFREITDCRSVIGKLVNSDIIDDWDDALIIGGLKSSFVAAEELLNKGNNAILFKYAKLAQGRICKETPNGYNTVEEQENQLKETENFLLETCTISFDIKPLKEGTLKSLFKKDKNDKSKKYLTPGDIQELIKLGLYKK